MNASKITLIILLLIVLTDNHLFKNISNNLEMFIHTYAYIYSHVSEINDSNDASNGRKRLGIFYYCELLALPMV